MLYVSKPGYTPLKTKEGKKICDLPQYAILNEEEWPSDGNQVAVSYPTAKIVYTGYVYKGFVEEYVTPLARAVVKISNKTLNPADAEQYIVWKNQIQYNLCGPLCVLYTTGWPLELGEYLDILHKTATMGKLKEMFYRVFPSFKSRGTTPYDLDVMLSLYDGYKPSPTFEGALKDPVYGKPIFSPGRVADILKKNYVISSCHIDSATGRLRGEGVLHWVVLESIELDRLGGFVVLYNPFTNSMEKYSWDEYIKSAGQPYGILVPRK